MYTIIRNRNMWSPIYNQPCAYVKRINTRNTDYYQEYVTDFVGRRG